MASLLGFDIAAIDEPIEPLKARASPSTNCRGRAPVAYPLSAVDGAFDTVQEAISTTLECPAFLAVAIPYTCRRKTVGKIGVLPLPSSLP